MDLVRQLKRDQGTTILYTTHPMEEAQELGDRMAIIHHGKVIALGTPSEPIRMLPGEDTPRLYIGPSPVPAPALDSLGQVPGVTRVAREGDALILSLHDAAHIPS